MDNSPLNQPVAEHLIGEWEITHHDGPVRRVYARLAFEAVRLAGWSMGEVVGIELLKTSECKVTLKPSDYKAQMMNAIAVTFHETRGINGTIKVDRYQKLSAKLMKLYKLYSST